MFLREEEEIQPFLADDPTIQIVHQDLEIGLKVPTGPIHQGRQMGPIPHVPARIDAVGRGRARRRVGWPDGHQGCSGAREAARFQCLNPLLDNGDAVKLVIVDDRNEPTLTANAIGN